MDKKYLKKAYDKANSSVQVVEQEAEQITMEEIAEVEDRQRILNNWIGNQNTSFTQKFKIPRQIFCLIEHMWLMGCHNLYKLKQN